MDTVTYVCGPYTRVLPERGVTVYSEHIGDTSVLCRGGQSALAGVFPDGSAATFCRPAHRGRKDGGALSRVRYLPQDRLQDLPAVQGLGDRGSHRPQPTSLSASEQAADADRDLDRPAQARA